MVHPETEQMVDCKGIGGEYPKLFVKMCSVELAPPERDPVATFVQVKR